MALLWERTYPFVFGIIAGCVWKVIDVAFPYDPTAILASSVSLGAILTGFLSTSLSILMGLRSNIMERVRDSGYIEELMSYIVQAVWLAFIFTLISLGGFFFNEYPYGILWAFTGTAAAFSFYRITSIFLKVLSMD